MIELSKYLERGREILKVMLMKMLSQSQPSAN